MIKLGALSIDPVEIGINGNAILGIKESGKSYLGTKFAEIMFDAGIPFVAFDPIGIWHNMRHPGAGKGYEIVVAGGFHGDMPLTPESAPTIVEAAMQNKISLVLDLFHPDLSKGDWRKIVRDCAMLLLHRNAAHGLRHIFIEEAAEFVPQVVRDGQVYDAVERVIRMGGNSRLGCTLITPRSQEVNKAVLELCENMFLFRQRGKNALENLKKWLDISGTAAADVMRTLPSLPTGECWAWLAGSDTPVHLKVPTKNSFHPNRRATHGDVAVAPKKAVSVDKFVGKLLRTLPALEAEAAAKDPKKLQAEIARLQNELAKKGAAPAYPDLSEELRQARNQVEDLTSAVDAYREPLEQIAGICAKILIGKVVEPAGTRRASPASAPPAAPVSIGQPPSQPKTVPHGEAGAVPHGCQKPLAALAGVYPAGMTEAQWAITAGYKRTGGTWQAYRSRLRGAGLIEQHDGLYYATESGALAVGDVETPPTAGPDLARWWAGKIHGTPKLVEVLIEAWPEALSRDELAARVGMTASGGSFQAYLSRLRTPGLLAFDARGIRLSDAVMGA